MAIKRKAILLEKTAPIEVIQKLINHSSKEIARVNDAMGLGQVSVKSDGVYRTFLDGSSVLIKKGNFRRKRLSNQRIKIA